MSASFNLHNRCPNCNGFAGAFKHNKRCRGFKHRDGGGYFCETPNEGKSYNFSGYDLFFYKTEGEEENEQQDVFGLWLAVRYHRSRDACLSR